MWARSLAGFVAYICSRVRAYVGLSFCDDLYPYSRLASLRRLRHYPYFLAHRSSIRGLLAQTLPRPTESSHAHLDPHLDPGLGRELSLVPGSPRLRPLSHSNRVG